MERITISIKPNKFLSTLSLRRATSFLPRPNIDRAISIHALLAESDRLINCPVISGVVFLSTLSLRRATVMRHTSRSGQCNFYPRSPCGERLRFVVCGGHIFHFYPRSPCGERPGRIKRCPRLHLFLSTLSLRRATAYSSRCLPTVPISIHALLAESDITPATTHQGQADFYPRSPCGERRVLSLSARGQPQRFLSTLSLRRATPRGGSCYLDNIISIHALLAESDNSRANHIKRNKISIHALLAESDLGSRIYDMSAA